MTLPRFIDRPACTTRLNCSVCRDPSATKIHEDWARYYELPGPDGCPLKRPMGWVPPVTPPRREPRPPEPLKSIPHEQWPKWAKALALLKSDEDAGVGDTVHRQLGLLGKAFTATAKALRVPCDCAERRDEWNILYSYAALPSRVG